MAVTIPREEMARTSPRFATVQWTITPSSPSANERERKAIHMDYNENKYWAEDSDVLTEAQRIQFAKDLLELESQGVLEYRDGTWGLADGVEVEETPAGPVAHFRKHDDASPAELATSSTTSSGEPSETRVPPVAKAARPLSEGSSSPDSDNEVSKQ
jgi:hypothetical protein